MTEQRLMTGPPVPYEKTEVTSASGVSGSPYVTRRRAYAFVVDDNGRPIELGSGRFAKAFLGEERWLDSRIGYRRPVAIKALQRGVSADDRLRFQAEKDILERVQPHAHIVEVLASGGGDSPEFVPPVLRERIDNDFIVLELLDMSLEERLKGSRHGRRRDDLVSLALEERLLATLDYAVPIATAIEFSHVVRDTCHRDIKPANILLKLPDNQLAGDQLRVKLADFNVAKMEEHTDPSLTGFQTVPGTMYFQSPEQEVNTFELLVNVTTGSEEVEFFEDFYMDICENDQFSLFNRGEVYRVVTADRRRKRIRLARPWAEPSERSVRARVAKAVGRPADIYSIGALLYYLISGAYANPKGLYDAFRKFIEYDADEENNTVEAYIEHEYGKLQHLRAPKGEGEDRTLAPQDRFFSYKHYLDGNGEPIDMRVMLVIARAMIRNKPDSYCQAHDLNTRGITELCRDLLDLYPSSADRQTRGRSGRMARGTRPPGAMRRALDRLLFRGPRE